jgi:hypothetical protein
MRRIVDDSDRADFIARIAALKRASSQGGRKKARKQEFQGIASIPASCKI